MGFIVEASVALLFLTEKESTFCQIRVSKKLSLCMNCKKFDW